MGMTGIHNRKSMAMHLLPAFIFLKMKFMMSFERLNALDPVENDWCSDYGGLWLLLFKGSILICHLHV